MTEDNRSREELISDIKLFQQRIAELEAEISKGHETEQALRLSEKKFSSFFEEAPLGYQSLDENGCFLEVNQAWLDTLGYRKEEVIGKWFGDFLAPEFVDAFRNRFPIFKAEGRIHSEFYMIHKNGDRRYIAFEGRVGYHSDGSFKQTHCILSDLSERKHAEQVLSFTKTKLELALQASRMGVWQFRIIENKRIFDDQTCFILGINPATFGGKPEEFFAVVHPSDHEKVKTALKKTIEQDAPYDPQYCVVWPDGSIHYVAIRGKLLKDDQGRPEAITGMVWDVTERKEEEERVQVLLNSLKEEKDKLGILIDSIPDEVWLADNNKKFTLANKKALSEFALSLDNGINIEDLAGSLEVYHSDMSPRPIEEAPPIRALAGEIVKNQEEIVRIPSSGELRYRQVNASPVKDFQGNVVGAVSIVRDLTELKKVEQQLRKSEARFRSYFDLSLSGVVITSPGKGWIEVNDKTCLMLGYSREELLTMTWSEMTHPDDLADDVGQFNRMLSGEIENYKIDKRFIRKDGQVVWTSLGVGCVRDPRGKVEHVVALLEDITKRKEAEEALRESEEKLVALFASMTEMVVLHELVFDEQGEAVNYRIIDCNNAFTEITGIKKENAIGKLATEVYQTETVPYLKEYSRVATTGEACMFVSYFSPMNKYFSISAVSPKKNQFATVTTDITERKQMDANSQFRTALLEAQTNATIDGILIIDENQKRVLTNQRIIDLFHVPQDILDNEDDAALLKYVVGLTKYPEQFLEKVHYLYDHITETSRDEIEFKNGMVLDRYSAPVLGKEGKNYGRIWTFRDVTDLKKSEKEKNKHMHELEVFYKASLGREERVVELKKEIEELKGKLERTKKNP